MLIKTSFYMQPIRDQRDHWFFRPKPRLVLIGKFCQDQDQCLIIRGQVLNFETKTKSLAEHLSSARPLMLFETKTKTSLDLKIPGLFTKCFYFVLSACMHKHIINFLNISSSDMIVYFCVLLEKCLLGKRKILWKTLF